MTPATTSHDIDRMIAELTAAGWARKTSVVWRAPNGALFLGPAGAWRRMTQQRDIATGRQGIIDRAMAVRVEIEQIFLDCAHWNDTVRKSDEAPIDPDEDGQLRRIADGLDRMLAAESGVDR